MAKLLFVAALLCACAATTAFGIDRGYYGEEGDVDPHHDHHPGLLPNRLNRGGSAATTNKAIIDLNHCVNEKKRAFYDVESAQNKLRFCEKEAQALRVEEERCRTEMHSLASEAELLKQENEMLRLRLTHAEGRDTQCSEALLEQNKYAEARVRAVVGAAVGHRNAEEGGDEAVAAGSAASPSPSTSSQQDGTAGSADGNNQQGAHTEGGEDRRLTTSGAELSLRARHRDAKEARVQALEARLLIAERDSRGYAAQRRALEDTVRELSHALEVERHKSRSRSRSRSRSLGLGDMRREDIEGVEFGGGGGEGKPSSSHSHSPSLSAVGGAAKDGVDEDDDEEPIDAEEVVKQRLRHAARAAEAAAAAEAESINAILTAPKTFASEAERARERKAENDLIWRVRRQAEQHEAQRREAAERLEQLRRTVESEDPPPAADSEDGAAL